MPLKFPIGWHIYKYLGLGVNAWGLGESECTEKIGCIPLSSIELQFLEYTWMGRGVRGGGEGGYLSVKSLR
jgi:hypothetical protein